MEKLATDYTVEVDSVDKDSWFEILQKFDDANIYQTWAYGEIRWGQDNLSHLVLKKNGETVAAVQVRIFKIPLINIGIAYIRSGPMWRLHGNEINLEIFRQTIRALREEYVIRRHLILRLLPNIINEDADDLLLMLENEGFKLQSTVMPYRTLLIDLTPSLEDLRNGLKQKWRNCLNRAEKNELEVIEGYDDELYDMFASIYREMYERKKFVEYVNIDEYKLIQSDLQNSYKMRIIVCKADGRLSSATVCSAIGNTGIYVLGASNNIGMKTKSSYLQQWKIIEWLKKHGYKWYDLGGINPITNPGTYHFKAGISGKNGKEVHFLGQFDACESLISLIIIKCVDLLRTRFRKAKERLLLPRVLGGSQ